VPHRLLRRDEDAGHIDGERPLVVGEIDIVDRVVEGDAGIVDEDVCGAELLFRSAERCARP
jgi:hypothetical protein